MDARMELSPRLGQTQTQILAPQQLQSLRILQAPIPELRDMLRHELEQNPVLEEVPLELPLPAAPALSVEDGDRENDLESDDFTQAADRYEEALAPHALDSLQPAAIDDAEAGARHQRLIDSLMPPPSLHSLLTAQLEAAALSPSLKRAGEYIIGNMDDSGRMEVPLEEIAREAGVRPEEAAEAQRIISEFDLRPPPSPGPAADDANFLIPEVEIHKTAEGAYTAELLRDLLPALHISEAYEAMLRDPATAADARKYLIEKIRSGRFWMDSLQRRRDTILRIAREIARVQAPFFDHGLSHLRPLSMADVANRIHVNESTVSRAIDGKSAKTPQGVLELRFFFAQGLGGKTTTPATADADNASPPAATPSTLAIRATIQKLIDAEDIRHPLSDQALAKILNGRGIPIARRTVAKYREQLGIPDSRLRK